MKVPAPPGPSDIFKAMHVKKPAPAANKKFTEEKPDAKAKAPATKKEQGKKNDELLDKPKEKKPED